MSPKDDEWRDPREDVPSFMAMLRDFYAKGYAVKTPRGVYISPGWTNVAVMYRGWRADRKVWPGWPPPNSGEKRSA